MIKRFFSCIVALAAISGVVSCSDSDKGDIKADGYTLNESEKNKIVSVVENTLSVMISEEASSVGGAVEALPLPVKVEKSYIKEIDGEAILVSVYKDYRANSLLKKVSSTKSYHYDGISCVSKKCSDSDGCIPDGKTRCTPCRYGAGDCTKTVTGD